MTGGLLLPNAAVFSADYLLADKSQYKEFFDNIMCLTPVSERGGLYLHGEYKSGNYLGDGHNCVFYHPSGAVISFRICLAKNKSDGEIHITGTEKAIHDSVSTLELLSQRRLEECSRVMPIGRQD